MDKEKEYKTKQRVVVAMSGGVDSSVAAYLLTQQGFDVLGVTMRLWAAEDGVVSSDHQGCCSIEDIEDARRVCQQLSIPHYVINVEQEFKSHVIEYFLKQYESGRTPHPCIACNDKIKFDFLLRRSLAWDADFIATGHYARIQFEQGQYQLLRGIDSQKDQSYVLFGLGQTQLSRILLPVGSFDKNSIRDFAIQAGLHLANKADSQEICFIPQGTYHDFLNKHSESIPGDLVDKNGKVLGQHPGVGHFTIGQRRGIGLASAEPLFVTKISAESREVVVGPEHELFQTGILVESVNYITDEIPHSPIKIQAQIRYNSKAKPALLMPSGNGAELWFEEPQKAITPGQAAVFYVNEQVIGGGYIRNPIPSEN